LNIEKYPTEVISLPSGGKLYDSSSPLSKGTIELRKPTARHEDILLSKNLVTKGVVLDVFLKSLIVDENIKYSDILLCDKNALLIASRILLYTEIYETSLKCPQCNETVPLKINLSDLDIKEVDESVVSNSFSFVLPYSNATVDFSLLTIADDEEIEAMLKSSKKFSNVSGEITTRLIKMINSINGDSKKENIRNFVNNRLLGSDSLALRNYISKITPGIDTKVLYSCDNCGHEDTVMMPMDINFFWPSK